MQINKYMKWISTAAVVLFLGVFAMSTVIAASVYGPTTFMDDVSVGSWSKVLAGAQSTTSGGFFTNSTPVYTNYYRVNGTNYKGRLPVSQVITNIFTGNTNTTNAAVVVWKYKPGLHAYVVEKSFDEGVTFTNWRTVSVRYTNWTDNATNTDWNTTDFTNTYGVIPDPTTPWNSTNVLDPVISTNIATNAAAGWSSWDATSDLNMAHFAMSNLREIATSPYSNIIIRAGREAAAGGGGGGSLYLHSGRGYDAGPGPGSRNAGDIWMVTTNGGATPITPGNIYIEVAGSAGSPGGTGTLQVTGWIKLVGLQTYKPSAGYLWNSNNYLMIAD